MTLLSCHHDFENDSRTPQNLIIMINYESLMEALCEKDDRNEGDLTEHNFDVMCNVAERKSCKRLAVVARRHCLYVPSANEEKRAARERVGGPAMPHRVTACLRDAN